MSSRKILFLACGKGYASKIAEVLFNTEAKDVNLPWTSISRRREVIDHSGHPIKPPLAPKLDKVLLSSLNLKTSNELVIPSEVAESDFKDIELVINIVNPMELSYGIDVILINAKKLESWVIANPKDFSTVIEKNVFNLIVKIIGQ